MKKCLKCGAENADTSVFCAGCGAALDQPAAAPAPSSYDVPVNAPAAAPVEKNTATLWLILNIVLFVVCCGNLLGLIGLIFAAIGMGSYNKGNYADMAQKAKIAKILFIVGIVLGVILWVIGLVLGVFTSILPFLNYSGY